MKFEMNNKTKKRVAQRAVDWTYLMKLQDAVVVELERMAGGPLTVDEIAAAVDLPKGKEWEEDLWCVFAILNSIGALETAQKFGVPALAFKLTDFGLQAKRVAISALSSIDWPSRDG
jgi:hypothetical protein